MRHLEPRPLGTSALGVPAATAAPATEPPAVLPATAASRTLAAAACRCTAAAAAAAAAAVGVGGDRVAMALRMPLALAECKCLALSSVARELPHTCKPTRDGLSIRCLRYQTAARTHLMMTIPIPVLARGAAVAGHVAAGAGFRGLATAVPALLLQVAAL